MADEVEELTGDQEGAQGAEGGGAGEEEFDADQHDLLLDDEGEEDKPPAEEKKGEGEDEVTRVKTELAKREVHIANLNKALHEARQEKKKGKDEGTGEAPLTKEQLLAIMKEHKDDEGVLLNVIQYAAEQAAKGAEKKAVDAVELSSKKKEIDDYLTKNYPKLTEEDSEDRASVNRTKDMLSISDHPYADFLAVSVRTQLMLPAILDAAKEAGKKEALGQNADTKRKATIKANSPAPGGKGPAGGAGKVSSTLSGDAADVAKRINLSPKGQAIYAKLLKGSNKSVSVED